MKKRICAVFMTFALLGSYAPMAVFATGYPVFDVSGWLAAIDQLYQAYDMVNNTITQIENQYKSIQHSIEVAKSIDWDNIRFDGDFDIRNDIKDANKRVNKLLTQARNIKATLTTPSINCGNVKYSIADLCGATDPDSGGARKNILTAISDYKTYMSDTMKTAVTDVVDGLNNEQKKAIWAKYGISPSNYVLVQTAHTEVLKGASNVLANAAEYAHNAKLEESLLRTSNIIRAATETKDSEGNPTQASMTEAIMYLFQHLSEQLVDLETAVYKSGEMAASGVMEEEQKEQEQVAATAEAERLNEAKNSVISGRARR